MQLCVWGSLRTHYILTHACLLQTLLHATHTLLPTAPTACPLTSSYNRFGASHADYGDTIIIYLHAPAQHATLPYIVWMPLPTASRVATSYRHQEHHDDALHAHSLLITCTDYVVLHTLVPMAPPPPVEPPPATSTLNNHMVTPSS